MAKINTIFTLTDNVTNPLKRINSEVENTNNSFTSLSIGLMGVNGAIQLVSAGLEKIKKIGGIFAGLVSEAGEYQMLLSRLTVALGDVAEAESYFKKIQEFAKITPFDVKGTTNAFILLKNAGMETQNVLKTISMIGDLAQGNDQAFNMMSMNMMQILANGKASMQDIKQFGTWGVPMLKTLKEIGREGDMSFDAIYQAMTHLTSEGGKFYNSMGVGAKTLEGRMASLQDSISQLKNSIGKTMLPVVQGWQRVFATFFEKLKTWFEKVSNWAEPMQKFFNSMYLKLNSLIATILYLGTVAIAVGAIMAVAWAVANWPLTVTIILITTLLSLFFDIVNDANEASASVEGFANQCERAGAIMGGVIGYIAGVFRIFTNMMYDTLATVYNALETVIEFILNMFTHPIKAIGGLFINLGTVILNILSLIAEGIDAVFRTNLSKSLNQASNKLQQFKKDHIATDGYVTGWAGKAGLLGLKGSVDVIGDAQKTSQTFGNFGKMFDQSFNLQEFLDQLNDTVEQTNKKNKYNSNGALVVSDSTLVDIADDYRELLSKKATERFNLQFSQVTPEINVGGITVNNNADLDDVLETLVSSAEQASATSLRS